MAVTYDLILNVCPIEISPSDFLEAETEQELDELIENTLLEDTGLDSEYIDNWSVDPEFYYEWKRLKEEELQQRQEEYEDDN